MVKGVESPTRARKVITFLVRLYCVFFLIATMGTITSLVFVNEFLANAAHVEGQVVDIAYGAKGTRAPIVRFTTTNGESIQLKSNLYTSPGPNVGDNVKVVYRISNPRDWRIDDWIHLHFWTFFGSIFMFAWGMAIALTKLIGDHQTRKLARAAGANGDRL
jgi:hypothetical protein